jgi:hypothetical protein
MLHALGDAGIGSLVAKYPDRSATATVTLGVIDTDTETRRCTSVDYGKPGDASELPQIQTFTGEISGTIVDAPRGYSFWAGGAECSASHGYMTGGGRRHRRRC